MYEIIFTERAFKDIQNFDNSLKKRIGKKLQQYAVDPQYYAKALINSKLGSYRFRIGDYRIIFDIDDNKIVVLRIGLRKDIYL
ncbi:MAG TPA: type II toxin-antitoxin system RelE/ParE family toxin [Spirochaetia bacterium]|nr:type II toxin-antitoxin system RelE/ParE family toxin [Spirochaetia bacterium]